MRPVQAAVRHRRLLPALACLTLLSAVSACGDGEPEGFTAPSPSPSDSAREGLISAIDGVPDPETAALWIDFDDTFGPDGSAVASPRSIGTASVRTTVATAAGGRVRREQGPDGIAARFDVASAPAPGAGSLGTVDGIPATAVVVEAAGADGLSPGAQPFQFGADFSVDREAGPADAPDNLLQRGSYETPAQYKLQLDRDVPSCRLTGADGAVAATANQRALPGRWYRAVCGRVGPRVTLTLWTRGDDGTMAEVGSWVSEGSLGPITLPAATPLAIGARTGSDGVIVQAEPDPYDGLLDNVFVSVG